MPKDAQDVQATQETLDALRRLRETEDAQFIKDKGVSLGVGDPTSPLYKQLLTEDEEKSVDDQGRPVVEGLPWSAVPTGIYLAVAVTGRRPGTDRLPRGGRTAKVPSSLCSSTKRNRHITVATFTGKPRFDCQYAGMALELPADLAHDALKRQYVVEWLAATAKEALAASGVLPSKNKAAFQELAVWVAETAEHAIGRSGL